MPLYRKFLFFLLLSASLVAAADGMRIAHVDSKLIFEGYRGTKKAQDEYDRQVAKWEQQANLLQKELGFVKERLEKQSLMLSDEQKRELEAEYARRDTELKKFIEKIYGRNGELLTENEKVSAPIIA
jgi:outer membrane protein